MSALSERVFAYFQPCLCDTCQRARALAAFADGPVADTAETVAPQAGIVGAEPDGNDGHTVTHV